MKVFEILYGNQKPITKEEITSRLRSFDWMYEYSGDLSKVASGNKQVEILENLVYQFWKTDGEKAIKLWNDNTPLGTGSNDVIPSFISRLSAQEPNDILPTQINRKSS